jgi:hypothetical protein
MARTSHAGTSPVHTMPFWTSVATGIVVFMTPADPKASASSTCAVQSAM